MNATAAFTESSWDLRANPPAGAGAPGAAAVAAVKGEAEGKAAEEAAVAAALAARRFFPALTA